MSEVQWELLLDPCSPEHGSTWYDEAKQPRCNTCGRFAFKHRDRDGRFVFWQLRCVSYDVIDASWEHE